ncbi:hypothetical protein DMUE_0065 [Dictyocoela muelleri]|nr:hypothetical protein DMUE_0065 [Dictyocoela muelleri]
MSFDFEICRTKTRTSIQIPTIKNTNKQPLTYWVERFNEVSNKFKWENVTKLPVLDAFIIDESRNIIKHKTLVDGKLDALIRHEFPESHYMRYLIDSYKNKTNRLQYNKIILWKL